MNFVADHYPSFGRSLKALRKRYRQIDLELDRFVADLAKMPLKVLGQEMASKPSGFPELWKFQIAIESERLSARKGLRLIAIHVGDQLRGLAVYTHGEYENQPSWAEMRKWITEEANKEKG